MLKARKKATKQVSDSETSGDELDISGLGFTDSEDDDDDFLMMSDEESSDDDDDENSDTRRKIHHNDDDEEEEEEYDFDGDGYVDSHDDYDEEEDEDDVIDLEAFVFDDERLDDSTGLFMDDLEDDLDEDSDFLVDDNEGIDAIVQDVLMGKRQELRNMIVQGVPFGVPPTATGTMGRDEREQQQQQQKKKKQSDVVSTKKSQKTKEGDAQKKTRTRDAEKTARKDDRFTLEIEPRTGHSPKKSYRQTTIGDTLSAAASKEDIIPVSRMMGEPRNSAWPIFGLINTMGSVASRGAEFISLLCQLTAEVPQDTPAILSKKTTQQEGGKKRRRSSSNKSAIQKHKRHRTLDSYLMAK